MLSALNLIRTLPRYSFSCLRYSSSGKHIVQMRGLDHDTTEQDVIQFFKPLGITPMKIHLNRDGSGRTAAFSEVEFNTHAEAVVALRKKNAFIGNRFIRLTLMSTDEGSEAASNIENDIRTSSSDGSVKKNRPVKSLQYSGQCIRMKNVPWRVTDQDIFEFFWPVGARPVAVQPIYNENGVRTGEFDVHFLSADHIQKAAAKNNAYFRNKCVHLSLKQS